ncbi:MAG: 3-hydroxyacyl-ACP dehydratase FabZ [Geminicoccaceae bacterium]|nr:3-hydroxyacyl-ACP dehydratase FabZ [Geminicoccaceae bacterium]
MSEAIRLPLDVPAIEALLPHRHPFLLIDRVLALEPGRRILARKCVSFNEPFFPGHFPGHPVMPGVLVVEAMAQAGGLLSQLSLPGELARARRRFYLVRIDKARFSRMVVPGDCLELEVELRRNIRGMALYFGRALVQGEEAASAELLCAEGRE